MSVEETGRVLTLHFRVTDPDLRETADPMGRPFEWAPQFGAVRYGTGGATASVSGCKVKKDGTVGLANHQQEYFRWHPWPTWLREFAEANRPEWCRP